MNMLYTSQQMALEEVGQQLSCQLAKDSPGGTKPAKMVLALKKV